MSESDIMSMERREEEFRRREMDVRERELELRRRELEEREAELALRKRKREEEEEGDDEGDDEDEVDEGIPGPIFTRVFAEIMEKRRRKAEAEAEAGDEEEDPVEHRRKGKNKNRDEGGSAGGGDNPPSDTPTETCGDDDDDEERDRQVPIILSILGLRRGGDDASCDQSARSARTDDPPVTPPPPSAQAPKRRRALNLQEDFYAYFTEAKELTAIEREIKNLDDLIALGQTYDEKDPKRYVINLRALHRCLPTLIELNGMIGMKNVKSMIMDLLFFRLQNFEDAPAPPPAPPGPVRLERAHRDPLFDLLTGGGRGGGGFGGGCGGGDDEPAPVVHTMESLQRDKEQNGGREMYHMVITGSPGCGKTEVAKILAKLYYCLGICKQEKFTLAKRSDMIGKYLGHTAKMTQEVFNGARGGVLFIDEAYSLGNPEGRDSFSKECIDTINQNLTENKDTVVFIAGYKQQLEESFFAYNPGLHRRFKFRLEVDKYNAEELRMIYIKKLKENKWGIHGEEATSIPVDLFKKNRDIFKFNGGDMENLWHLTKIVHARRIFGKPRDLMRKIAREDVTKAIELYMENDEVKRRNEDVKKYLRDTLYV